MAAHQQINSNIHTQIQYKTKEKEKVITDHVHVLTSVYVE